MTQLTAAQIKGLAQAVGFTDAQSAVMTAIAFAESSGVTTKHNPIPPDDSYGLWQINMYGAMGPSRRQQFGITSNSQLYDVGVNAAAAKAIYGSQGYGAWSTYGGPTYRLYLPKAQAAIADASTITQGGKPWYDKTLAQNWGLPGANAGAAVGSAVTSASDVAGQVSRISDAVGKGGNWLSNAQNWLRIGYVAGGAVLAVMALQALFKPLIGGAVSQVAGALPAGKVMKAAGSIGSAGRAEAAHQTETRRKATQAYHTTRAQAQAKKDVNGS